MTCLTGKREKTVLRSLSLMMERDLEMEVETLGVPELRSFSVSYKMKYTILYLSTFSHKLTTSMHMQKFTEAPKVYQELCNYIYLILSS